MASKKKTVRKVKTVTHKQSYIQKSNNSLMMLCLACGVMLSSYFLFTRLSTERSMMNASQYMTSDKLNGGVMQETTVTAQLIEQNNSGEYGNATLTEVNGKTVVHVEVKNAPRGVSQPAHLHTGSCIDLGDVKYPLTNLVNGVSETTIDMPLKAILSAGPLALNVHKSVAQVKQYVSCGNVE